MSLASVNDIVWFWKNGEGRGIVPEPAIVTRVLEEPNVDLWVFCGHGAQREEKNVPIAQPVNPEFPYPPPPLVRYATLKAVPDPVEVET